MNVYELKKDRGSELDDEAMMALLDEVRSLYEDGAILEAAVAAERFAKRIRRFSERYDRSMGGGDDERE